MKKHVPIGPAHWFASLLAALSFSLPLTADVLHVPSDYATIQAAVNAAFPGTAIYIAPGVYVEQIAITNKNLVLIGSPGAVIRASNGLVPTTPHHCTVSVLGIVRCDVVVQGLTFEGEHLADEYACSYSAIAFDGGSGRVEDCTVRGFRPANRLSGFDGFGVTADNYDNTAYPLNVQVLRCTFVDNGVSVFVRGSDEANDPVRLTFTIGDSTITGIGSTTLGTQIGILISAGASGEVVRNTISDHSFADPTGTSFGIFAVDWRYQFGDRASPIALKAIRYEHNTFRNNQRHLASALGHGSQFVKNTFEGISLSAFAGGLALTGNTNHIFGNEFSYLIKAVTLIGDDPTFHTAYGIAKDTSLIENRFCHVNTPITVEPLVTGTIDEGTLECPFPDPILTIDPAVFLSWPRYTEGWILETAPKTEGPWTTVDATPTLREGQNVVMVKSDAGHRFFRMRKP